MSPASGHTQKAPHGLPMKTLSLFTEFRSSSHPQPPHWIEVRGDLQHSFGPKLSHINPLCFHLWLFSDLWSFSIWSSTPVECNMCSVMNLQLKFQNVLQSPTLNRNSQPSRPSVFPHLAAQSRNLNYHTKNRSSPQLNTSEMSTFFFPLLWITNQYPLTWTITNYWGSLLIICSFGKHLLMYPLQTQRLKMQSLKDFICFGRKW